MQMLPHFLEDAAQATDDKLVSILAAGLGLTMSWHKGTEQGPEAILAASDALELLDDELLVETWKVGLETLPPLALRGLAADEAWALVGRAVRDELERQRLVVTLGGEHSLTVPAVLAHLRSWPDLHVLQLDAHLDLREQYEGDTFSHACVMRRLHEAGVPFTQVGIRSFSREEWEFCQTQGLKPFTVARMRKETDWQEQVVASLKGPVYVTFDVDVLDPAIMPATGTPEPDGLSWAESTELLRKVAERCRIVGLDFVEFAPQAGAHHAAFTVAKLIYRTLGYIYYPWLAGQGKEAGTR